MGGQPKWFVTVWVRERITEFEKQEWEPQHAWAARFKSRKNRGSKNQLGCSEPRNARAPQGPKGRQLSASLGCASRMLELPSSRINYQTEVNASHNCTSRIPDGFQTMSHTDTSSGSGKYWGPFERTVKHWCGI